MDDVALRPAVAADAPFLQEMLAAAADWRPDLPPRSVAEILAIPVFAHYVDGWPQPHDAGFVAVDRDGRPLGATWWRYLSAADPGFGFVDEMIPELTIGVVADARGRGIGTSLLRALIAESERRGLPALSLSVEPDNPARRIYERLGFEPAGASGGAVTLLRPNR